LRPTAAAALKHPYFTGLRYDAVSGAVYDLEDDEAAAIAAEAEAATNAM